MRFLFWRRKPRITITNTITGRPDNTGTTRWWPDTCGCCLVYDWDNTEPSLPLLIYRWRVLHKCEKHRHLPLNEIGPRVYLENKSKNLELANYILGY